MNTIESTEPNRVMLYGAQGLIRKLRQHAENHPSVHVAQECNPFKGRSLPATGDWRRILIPSQGLVSIDPEESDEGDDQRVSKVLAMMRMALCHRLSRPKVSLSPTETTPSNERKELVFMIEEMTVQIFRIISAMLAASTESAMSAAKKEKGIADTPRAFITSESGPHRLSIVTQDRQLIESLCGTNHTGLQQIATNHFMPHNPQHLSERPR